MILKIIIFVEIWQAKNLIILKIRLNNFIISWTISKFQANWSELLEFTIDVVYIDFTFYNKCSLYEKPWN